ncbi:hypothetical protein DCCM_0723 [Desulfocucumis palustris]|uniref:Uncharacterized protein n=1 Tax=Desulfocucumis palustris TaxID=1898651 RepID=A0A2L2X8H9_9FIRM|nr:hypothetical protein DCCM_0723 [Desulfocucumis palustris]
MIREEIQRGCPFSIKTLGYLPNGYVLKEVNKENVSKSPDRSEASFSPGK